MLAAQVPPPPALGIVTRADIKSFNFPEDTSWSNSQQFFENIKENFKTLDDICSDTKSRQADMQQSMLLECVSEKDDFEVYSKWIWSKNSEVRKSFESEAYKLREDQMIAFLEGENWMGLVPVAEALSWSEDLGVTPKWLWRCIDVGHDVCRGGKYFNRSDL